MKKIIIFAVICIFIFGAFGCTKDKETIKPETLKPIEFANQQKSDRAAKILYNFAQEELLKNSPAITNQIQCPSFNIHNTYSYEYDINDDGQNEIIGKIHSSIHCGQLSCAFFILQKQNGKWTNLAQGVFVPVTMKIKPLESKSGSYIDFQIKDIQTGKVSTITYDKQNNYYTYK